MLVDDGGTWGGQRTTFESFFSLSTMWVLGFWLQLTYTFLYPLPHCLDLATLSLKFSNFKDIFFLKKKSVFKRNIVSVACRYDRILGKSKFQEGFFWFTVWGIQSLMAGKGMVARALLTVVVGVCRERERFLVSCLWSKKQRVSSQKSGTRP